MKTTLRTLAGLLLAASLCVSAAPSARAEYGNHAERATANIQLRVGIAKASLLSHVSQFQIVEARGGLPMP